jgi:hypothetical protein
LHVSFSLGVAGSLGRSLRWMDLVNRGWLMNFAESDCSLGYKIENITLDSISLQTSLEKQRGGSSDSLLAVQPHHVFKQIGRLYHVNACR